jgi:hypothetical protein
VGRFRECFGRYRNLWITEQIDSRDVEGTNKEYLQSIVDTYGIDSDIAKVRVLGQFPSASRCSSSAPIGRGGKRERDRRAASCRPIPSSSASTMRASATTQRAGDPAGPGCRLARGSAGKARRRCRSLATSTGDARYRPDAVFIDAGGPMLAA